MTVSGDYTIGQKIVHWLMSILIILDLFAAQKFGRVMADPDRLESRIDHASLGSIIAALFIIRLYLRFRHGAPPLPAGMPGWQRRAARLVHFALYFFIGFLILSGISTAINATAPIPLFGQFDIVLGQTDDATFDSLQFASGAVLASFTFFFALGYGAGALTPLFSKPVSWKILDVIIAAVMWMIAASLLTGG